MTTTRKVEMFNYLVKFWIVTEFGRKLQQKLGRRKYNMHSNH